MVAPKAGLDEAVDAGAAAPPPNAPNPPNAGFLAAASLPSPPSRFAPNSPPPAPPPKSGAAGGAPAGVVLPKLGALKLGAGVPAGVVLPAVAPPRLNPPNAGGLAAGVWGVVVAAAGAAPKRPPTGAGVLAAGLGVPNSPPPEGAAPPNSEGKVPAVLAGAPNPNEGAALAAGVVPVLAAGAPKASTLLVAAELPKIPPAGAAAEVAGCPKRPVVGAEVVGGVEAVGEQDVSCCSRRD